MTVEILSLNAVSDHVMERDRIWFEETPDQHQCIRPLAAGEFDIIGIGESGSVVEMRDLPAARPGREWITLITVLAPGVRLRQPIEMPAVGIASYRVMRGMMITDNILRAIETVAPKYLASPWWRMVRTKKSR